MNILPVFPPGECLERDKEGPSKCQAAERCIVREEQLIRLELQRGTLSNKRTVQYLIFTTIVIFFYTLLDLLDGE